ncbi:DUF4232 domain-containing protein [Streptomyces sp. NPDC051776]|uniref:DUF4232 domain-containing protein n=1 Tax=Streptomyces sp. NPDC051776 TaxID=3155414 RepID=UPI00344772A0
MRMRALTAATGAALLATLTLTACGPEDSGDASGSGKMASPSEADSSGDVKGPASGGSSANGDADTSTGGNDGDGEGGDALVSCTTKTTEVRFLASATNATDLEPAKGTVLVRNTSSAPCTLTGPTNLTAKDDKGKDGSLSTDNSAAGSDAVDIPAHGQVAAVVEYTDTPSDGTGSPEACPVKASEVEIALPKDEARGVQVTEEGGAPARFTVCAPAKVKFGAFKR